MEKKMVSRINAMLAGIIPKRESSRRSEFPPKSQNSNEGSQRNTSSKSFQSSSPVSNNSSS
jgi:hypothetical protein